MSGTSQLAGTVNLSVNYTLEPQGERSILDCTEYIISMSVNGLSDSEHLPNTVKQVTVTISK